MPATLHPKVLVPAALAAIAALAALAAAAAPAGAQAVRGEAAGGEHWRIETPRGPIHVWRPGGYRQETAGLVLYVHGYYTDVDRAWSEHRLAEQFRDSGQNALFIVPEAPAGAGEAVHFPSLGDLVRTVRRATRLERPWGHVVAVVHSGGYRTLLSWLDDRHLDHVILVDALYGGEEQLAAWLAAPRRENRMIVVAADTLRWTEPFARRFPDVRRLEKIPDRVEDLGRRERGARLLYLLSQVGHMQLVESGKVLPLLLRLTRLEHLERLERPGQVRESDRPSGP